MNIHGKTISATLAITLIGIAPAWQSLLKTLDPDNDGTVDLAEAKMQPRSCSTSSTAIMTAP